ncbi:nucleoside/nucleotide kinase family protein [Aeromicrobium chenweiae]|uniref:Nucleoside/nucleotide kinase family protein n=1 Tax=Aeromicrobium chenweiae TaxID=2079793 RepID=A0A2S0WRV7_9ACTN|nr:nucleoside/nucleotide kinase family protein [Aeromicrobium chenweiae]AWB93974.1 nucleoside/nucleotide kinase family protein [Aeromicrobium chenweiae]TGN32122.1 nucleoside/nucleotide kinase family protein [Aeromicrobium chenweiae]
MDDLLGRVRDLVTDDGRTIVGICGAPGSGKTTVAKRLASRLTADGVPAVRVPMDGFHLSDDVLRARGLLDVKGAPQTFDAYGFLALLARLRTETDHPVYAPGFERTLEQPIAAAIAVDPGVRVLVTEGNYLLDADDPWPLVREALDEVWFVDLDDDRRRARLVDRHVKFGKSRDEAQAWVDRVDEPNARRVIARRDTADLVIHEG